MIALKGTPTGKFTPTTKNVRSLIHAILSPTKPLTIGQICLLIRTRFGVYVSPDTLMVLLLSDPAVVKDYSGELRFKKKVAAKTLPEYFRDSDDYGSSNLVENIMITMRS